MNALVKTRASALAASTSEERWALQELARISTALGEVKSALEAEHVSQRTHAISELAERARMCNEVKIEAAALVLHCERAVGEALRAMPKSAGGRPRKTSSPGEEVSKPLTRKELGVIGKRADNCKRLASVPAATFTALVDTARQKAETAVDRVSSCLSVRRVVEQIRSSTRADGDPEYSPIIRPDDNWNFSRVTYDRIDGEDGHGYIPGDLYANCLWYYTKPGDVVAAPMAGAGQIMRVYEDRAVWARPEPWDLDIRMSDLSPRGPYADRIKRHDLRVGFPIARADYIVMDVPYFGMVERQYSAMEEDLANMDLRAWTEAIRAIARNCAGAQTEGGLCTAISPNHLDTKTGRKVMATHIIASAFERAGYDLHDKAYASRRIQQTQGAGMARLNTWAKRSRTTLTDTAEVMPFRRIG